jgi:hypothetical protein
MRTVKMFRSVHSDTGCLLVRKKAQACARWSTVYPTRDGSCQTNLAGFSAANVINPRQIAGLFGFAYGVILIGLLHRKERLLLLPVFGDEAFAVIAILEFRDIAGG